MPDKPLPDLTERAAARLTRRAAREAAALRANLRRRKTQTSGQAAPEPLPREDEQKQCR